MVVIVRLSKGAKHREGRTMEAADCLLSVTMWGDVARLWCQKAQRRRATLSARLAFGHEQVYDLIHVG